MEQLQRASFIRRAGAFFIDHFITCLCVTLPLLMFTDFNTPHFSVTRLGAAIAGAFILYCCKDIIGGRSIGKRMFGIGVRDERFRVPTTSRLIIRNVFTFLWIVELLLIVGSTQKKKLGDRLAHTDVYLVNKNSGVIGIIVSILFAMILFVGGLFLGVIQIMKQSTAYTVATNDMMSNSEISTIVGDDFTFGYFPTGSIQVTNGYGSAQLRIKVKGSKGTVVVYTVLKKAPDSSWVIDDVRLLERE